MPRTETNERPNENWFIKRKKFSFIIIGYRISSCAIHIRAVPKRCAPPTATPPPIHLVQHISPASFCGVWFSCLCMLMRSLLYVILLPGCQHWSLDLLPLSQHSKGHLRLFHVVDNMILQILVFYAIYTAQSDSIVEYGHFLRYSIFFVVWSVMVLVDVAHNMLFVNGHEYIFVIWRVSGVREWVRERVKYYEKWHTIGLSVLYVVFMSVKSLWHRWISVRRHLIRFSDAQCALIKAV